jgi:photosystem II stability/assembly factor-like uncharacterized protein
MKSLTTLCWTAGAASLLVGCHPTATLAQTAPKAATVKTQPYVWRNVQIVAGGFVDGLVFHPKTKDVLYARTDIGGAYRWDPTAKQWIPLQDWLGATDWNLYGVDSIGLDPNDSQRLYLAVGTYTGSWAGNGAILRSSDQGRTWKRTDLPFKNGGNMDGRSAGERLAVDPNLSTRLYFGSRDNGLWQSTNGAATWSQVMTFPVTGRTNGIGTVFIMFDPSTGTRGKATATLYAGVSQDGPSLYRSVDAGKTWEAVPGQPSGLLPHQANLASDGSLYLTYGNAPGPNGMTSGAVWKYATKTSAWTDITPLKPGNPAGFGYAGLTVQRNDPNTLIVTTLDRWNPSDTLFRSRDGGKTWVDLGPKTVRDWSAAPYMTFGAKAPRLGWWMGAVALDPFRPGHVLYGTGATIWASGDVTHADTGQPTHWAIEAQGLEEAAVLDLASPPAGPPLLSAMYDIGGFRHDDLTVSPARGMETNPLMTNIDSLDFAELQPALVVRSGSGDQGKSGAYSLDSGATWAPFVTEPSGPRGSGPVAVSADGSNILWTPHSAALSMTHDHGATWQACAGAPMGLGAVADRVNPHKFYGVNGGTLYATLDSGATWTAAASGLPNGGKLRATPGEEGDLWLTAGDGLYHSTDGGTAFVRVTTAASVHAQGFGKAAPGRTYPALYIMGKVGEVSGFFRSDNAGATWVRINDDAHGYGTAGTVIGDPRVYGRVYVGTNGRGILYGEPAPRKAANAH